MHNWKSTERLAVLFVFLAASSAAPQARRAPDFQRVVPTPAVLKAADLRMPASRMLPQVESHQVAVFSGSVSGIPLAEGLDRITAPPLTAILRQRFEIREKAAGGIYPADGAKAPELVWEPGRAVITAETGLFQLEVEQVPLRVPQGFVLRATIRNTSREDRQFTILSRQQPAIRRPKEWTYGSQFGGDPAPGRVPQPGIALHVNEAGAVAFGMTDATAALAATPSSSTIERTVTLAPSKETAIYLVVATGASPESALASCREVLRDPARASGDALRAMQADIDTFLGRLPALSHPDPRVVRFYHQAALQLLYARWRIPGTLRLDPWYAVSGLDSGGLNAYAWDFGYSAVPLTLLDPQGMRAAIVALLGAPLTEHFSIGPIRGEGSGPFYSYSPYAFTWAVDQYLRVTGDRALLSAQVHGRTVLDWLIELAEYGEKNRDADGNNLVDYGDDHNLLELKKTGDGPGYIHEVPSPNAERAWIYGTLADILEEQRDNRNSALAKRFRARAQAVRRAVNDILWLEDAGWYGTRQKDGKVVPIWSIQIFDLLRIPGFVPPARAARLAAHLNEDEFLGKWGMRSMSIKDRLFDYRDHDWAGPMTYIGDSPQIVADLFQAGFIDEAWRVWERFLWWPEYMVVYPQGVGNEDYTFKFRQAGPFGGRIGAGRTNLISGCVGVEAVVRGLFGVEPGRDGSIRFRAVRRPQDPPSALAYPFRGRTWTVTQRREGIDAVHDDGVAATLFREDGTLWFGFGRAGMTIRASARSGGEGLLAITSPATVVRVLVNGQVTRPRREAGRLWLDLRDLGGEGARIMIATRSDATRRSAP
jgi:hypothetical protein